MNRSRNLPTALGLLLLLACSSTRTSGTSPYARSEDVVTAQVEESWRLASEGDFDAVSELDFGLTSPGKAGLENYTVAVASSDGSDWDVSTAEQQSRLREDDFNLDVATRDMHVILLGEREDVAHVSYHLIGTITMATGEVRSYGTRVSQVLERIREKWVIRGAHYSPLSGTSGIPGTD